LKSPCFIYRINGDTDNQNCLSFGVKLKGQIPEDSEDDWHFYNIRNVKTPYSQNDLYTYTAAELLDDNYSTSADSTGTSGFRKVTFFINLESLIIDGNHLFGDEIVRQVFL